MEQPGLPQEAQLEAGELKTNRHNFLIAGIGASAGGIQALKEFFEQVPADSDIAYVVILHLSPDHESQLASVLQTVATIPVNKVTAKIQVQPNNVYVVPPNQSLKMLDGYIIVEPIHTTEERRAPVDIFFRTLAESHQSRAVAVVLSGTGADGSMGLKRVKEKGGAVFVQNPREAEYNDMPRNAIATDLVDAVMNVRDIPQKIIGYRANMSIVAIEADKEILPENQQSALREIFSQLRIRTGHDFANYKRGTVLRRIERRIHVRQLESLEAYAAFLRETPEEAQALLKDLLISVTNFFRDKDAFHHLETVIIPNILQNKNEGNPVRVWVAGCATGEEAYSLAMLLTEQTPDARPVPVQIFGSDIDDAAIATAREGFYTINDAADVSTERLNRFFIKQGDGYRIRRELREMVLFANHNIIKDPPFSHVDLITCRNLLIYLNRAAQQRLMETFHFALNPGCYLFLGNSESVEGASDLYATVSNEHHLFQSRQVTTRSFPVPDTSLPNTLRFKAAAGNITAAYATRERENPTLERISLGDLHQRLLEQYAPPSILINEEYDIVHLSDRAGRFLQMQGGEPSNNLLKQVKPELRLELRTALYQALQQQTNVEVKNLSLRIENQTEILNIQVRPVLRPDDTARGFILVLFEPALEQQTDAVKIISSEHEPIVHQLEEELIHLKTKLRTSNEQFEVQTEELKASNEELQAMNEELRSAAEELETSKEELQSVNEELVTVNQELKIKIEEYSQSNNDFQNLINSIDIGTVFLDRNFRVKLFTPAAKDIFNLIKADIGRPLSDITSRLENTDLLADAETVIKKLQPIEREVQIKDGSTYLMQVLPYRTAEDRINGVVIVFVNITQIKAAEEALKKSEERMRLLIESVSDFAIFTITPDNRINSWNTGAEKLFGWTEREALGQLGEIIFTPEDRRAQQPEQEMTTALETGRAPDERFHLRKDGSRFYVSGIMQPLKDGEGFVKIARDMTLKLEAETIIHQWEERYRIALEAGGLATWDWNLITNKIVWNEQHYILFGLQPDNEEKEPKDFIHFIHANDVEYVKKQLDTAITTTGVYEAEFRIVKNGDTSTCWMAGYGRVVERDKGKATRMTGVMYDITDRKIADEELKAAQASLNIALEASKMGVWDLDVKTGFVKRSARHDQLLGYPTYQEEWNVAKAKRHLHDDDKKKFDAAFETMYTTGRFDLEARVLRDNGSTAWIHYFGNVFYNAQQEPEQAAGVIYDITDRKTIERQKEDFIGIASHELKTPVTSIKAYAEILYEKFADSKDQQTATFLSKMNGQIDRLTQLIKDLLDVTKISGGKLLLNESDIQLNQLLQEVADGVQRTTIKHKIIVEAQVIPVFKGDKERMRQVFVNLLSNAIKYSPEGDKIIIRTYTDENKIKVAVQDFGMGMTAETKNKLFERFFRSVDANSATFPGLGLGLYISMQIVKQHKGDIHVESKKGSGSVFTVEFPAFHQ